MKERYVLIGRDEKGNIAATTVQQFRTIQELMVARKRKSCCKAPSLFKCKCDIGLMVDEKFWGKKEGENMKEEKQQQMESAKEKSETVRGD